MTRARPPGAPALPFPLAGAVLQWGWKGAAPPGVAYRRGTAMALRILNSPHDAEPLAEELRARIEREIPGARARVRSTATGHFEIEVESAAFAGKPRVRQHQMVYSAIAPLMAGDAAPVHAVDKLDCRVP